MSVCIQTCVHHKADESFLSWPPHTLILTLSHIHLKHRISLMPQLSPEDPSEQSAAQAISPECLSGGCILSCLPFWTLPSQTAVQQQPAPSKLSQSLLRMKYGLAAGDSQVVIRFIRNRVQHGEAFHLHAKNAKPPKT